MGDMRECRRREGSKGGSTKKMYSTIKIKKKNNWAQENFSRLLSLIFVLFCLLYISLREDILQFYFSSGIFFFLFCCILCVFITWTCVSKCFLPEKKDLAGDHLLTCTWHQLGISLVSLKMSRDPATARILRVILK